MNNSKNFYLMAGLVIGAVLTWIALTGTVGGKNGWATQMLGLGTVTTAKSDVLDAHFIEQMIPHHEDAITMSRLAENNAKKLEVKKLAQSIITSQNAEISQMRLWYKEWFGRELPTGEKVMKQHGMMGGSSGMHMGMMGSEADKLRLETAADFDVAFIENMIPHHQMAVMMASMLKNGTTRPEMKKLADDIVTAQTSEIDDMRKWLGEWKK